MRVQIDLDQPAHDRLERLRKQTDRSTKDIVLRALDLYEWCNARRQKDQTVKIIIEKDGKVTEAIIMI